jgi:hypothetical protein
VDRSSTKAAVATAVIVVLVVLALTLPFWAFGERAGSYVVGALAGIPSGFLLAVALYWMTGPSLRTSVAGSKYDGISDGFWVHLAVRNDSWNVLGSGTARECVGKVRFLGMRNLAVSWKGRPNPVREVPVTVPGGPTLLLKLADPALYDQKRMETIRPGDPEEKWLDVAWRPLGKSEAYVSIPEHFRSDKLTLFDDLKLAEGDHPFSLEFEYAGGKSRRFFYTLVNKGGTSMSSESLFIRPATPQEERKIREDARERKRQ